MGVRLRAGLVFFDAAELHRRADRASLEALMRGARAIHDFARKSLRPARHKRAAELTRDEQVAYAIARNRNGGRGAVRLRPYMPSAPGEPPRVRPKSPLKRLLLYAFDRKAGNAYIGPAVTPSGGKTPPVLEEGGASSVVAYDRNAPMRKRWKRKTVNVAARPFMRPAWEKELPQLPERWRGSISVG